MEENILAALALTHLAAVSALVAGIMVFICFDELIPIANRYGSKHFTNLEIIVGFFIMMIELVLTEKFLMHYPLVIFIR